MSDRTRQAETKVSPTMAPELEVIRGDNKGEVFRVKMKTRIGRERDNDVILLDLKSSRYHAEIALENGQWLVSDLQSANGTFVNGASVTTTATPLQHGDQLSIGETDMIFKMPVRPQPSADQPASTAAGPPPPAAVPRRGSMPAPQKSLQPPRIAWIAGGGILLLFLAAMLVLYLATNRMGGTDTASNDIPQPTRNATTAAGQVSSSDSETGNNDNQPVPGRPAELALVYEDDFSDSFGGWDDAFDAYTRKVYGNNRYNIEVYASNLVAWGLANRIVSDFEIEVEAKLEDGDVTDSYGLIFRFEDRENFYRYDISGDGYYLFSKFIDGEWITLIDWTRTEFINTGGATNVLKVSAFGPNITLWANGQQLASVTDDSLQRGNFGFFTGTFSEPYGWVSFDNLKMWTEPGEEIVLIPTATPIGADTLRLTPSATPTPALPTATATPTTAGELVEGTSPVATPTRTASPTRSVTPTSVPLPEYASRDQTLARGEQEAAGQLIFPVYDSSKGSYDIYSADIADGDNLRLVQSNASQPALNSDSAQIAYRSWQPDKRGLFARRLTAEPESAWGFDLFFESARPQFSPINDTLMYHSRTSGREPAIYRVDDGVGQVMRRDGAPIQGKSPKWSVDGEQIVYSGCMGSACGIILSNADGSNPALLTDHPSDTNPELDPSGSTIVFMSERAGNWEIYRVDSSGDNLEALTTDPAGDGLPTWSPDGSKIAFASNRDGEWSIYLMNPDGSNKRRQFVIDGSLDGIVQHDPNNSFGWVEENIVWVP